MTQVRQHKALSGKYFCSTLLKQFLFHMDCEFLSFRRIFDLQNLKISLHVVINICLIWTLLACFLNNEGSFKVHLVAQLLKKVFRSKHLFVVHMCNKKVPTRCLKNSAPEFLILYTLIETVSAENRITCFFKFNRIILKVWNHPPITPMKCTVKI